MDGHNHPRRHDLPPLSSAAAAAVILPQPPLGFSPTLQSYLFSNNPISHNQYHFSHYSSSSSSTNNNNSFISKDAWSTKLARTKRKLARQKTLTLTKSSSSSSSSSSNSMFGKCSNDEYSKPTTITHYPNTHLQSNTTQNLFTFCTPDNKILRMLLKKELKNSDVGSLGRIVLPKREAEENLPLLTDKEGIQIVIRDVNSNRKWAMKYKYWANNRSRMYVLENTGDFVRQNGLLMGDVMTLYQDECKNLYVSVEKEENDSSVEENDEDHQIGNNNYNNNNYYGKILHSGTAAAGANYINMDIKQEQQQHDEDQNQLISLALFNEQPTSSSSYNNNNNNNNLVVSQNITDHNSYLERWSSTAACYMMINSNNNNNNNGRPFSNMGANSENGNKEIEDLQGGMMINSDFEDCFGGLDTLPEVSGLFKFHQIT